MALFVLEMELWCYLDGSHTDVHHQASLIFLMLSMLHIMCSYVGWIPTHWPLDNAVQRNKYYKIGCRWIYSAIGLSWTCCVMFDDCLHGHGGTFVLSFWKNYASAESEDCKFRQVLAVWQTMLPLLCFTAPTQRCESDEATLIRLCNHIALCGTLKSNPFQVKRLYLRYNS